MNPRSYRLVFNKHRGMLMAVEESATSTGKGQQAGSRAVRQAVAGGATRVARFALPAVTLAAWLATGLPVEVAAQVVGDPNAGANQPTVVQTANGLPQVNITRPSSAGVSTNAYTQFDVPRTGVILNNSPTVVSTQQAGYINGNANLLPGGSARIIVNQVTSTLPSQLRGYLEVAGPKSEVIVANPNGILVDGAGFINTSRATLTTGVPVFGGSGSLDAFRVTGGLITIDGAGLNASNVDQVDLIARAVQANAALYANQLNVVAGANQVDRSTLATTPIAGSGVAPALGIDVSQLGGMYANKIVLASTELGVGVSNRGVVAAQAGDVTRTAQGKLVLAGQTNAAGPLTITARDGIDNSGITYGTGAVAVSTGGALTNAGTLAAQQGLTINAGSVASGGTLGAGVNADGSIAPGSDLTVTASGALSATGQNVAGGSATLQGSSITLAGSQTAANGNLSLVATAGNLDLTGASASAGGSFAATAQGALVNDRGQISAAGDASINAASLHNDAGSLTAGRAITASVGGSLSNRQGTISAATLGVAAGALDNTSGWMEGDQVSLRTTGDLVNRSGHVLQYGPADAAVAVGGTLDNMGGQLAANGQNLTVSAGALANDGGRIAHAGSGALAVTSQGVLANVGGAIETNGALLSQAGSVNNAQGTLYGQTGLSVTSGDAFNNTGGTTQTSGDLAVAAADALNNAGGTLAANGAASQATIKAASVDNSAGRLVNAGTGTTTVTAASSLNNTGGALGGNGDVTVNAQDLINTSNASLVAAGALALNTTHSVDNRAGTLYGGTGLTIDQANATLANDGGQILSSSDATLNVATLSNQGGAVRANQDIAVQGTVTGSGEMTAGRNLALDVVGDYTNDAANQLHANGDMRVAASGTLTNTAQLAAGGSLTVSGANVVNAAGAGLNGTTTTVLAANAITNAGRIDGDTVQTTSATLDNTGTVIGNTIQLQSTDVTNSGASAVIAAAQDLKVYATNSVSNLDGATIYSAGNLQIARDGTRDASGMLANQVNALTNRSATIEADGDIDIAARTVSNTRTSIVTEAGTPVTSAAQTLAMWNAGMSGSDLNFHESVTFPSWRWSGQNASVSASRTYALMAPVTVTVPKSTVSNLDTSAKTLSFTQAPIEEYYTLLNTGNCDATGLCSRPLTTNATQSYQSIQDNGTTYSITFWPDWDPKTQIRPDQVSVRYDLGVDSHDYSEISRTTVTTTATDRLVSATDPGKIQANGAIRINSAGGSILNQSSIIAAGGDLTAQASGGGITNTGTALQQSVSTEQTSTFYWHQKTGGNSDTQVVPYPTTPQAPTTVMALPGVVTANQAVQIVAQDVTIATVNPLGQTVTASGVAGGGAVGAQVRSLGQQTLGAGLGGIPNLTLPSNGLFRFQTAPGATYLVATDPRFTQYKSFISSDYMLGQLGLDPQKVQKRLGDGFYEEKLVRDQVTQLTGRTFLAGYSDQLEEYKALMTNGATYAKAFNLAPGIGLTDAQMAQLTTDMVWLVSQEVTLPDGTRQSVLVPKLYLAQSSAVDLTDTGALVAGKTASVAASGNAENSGRIVGDVATQVVGQNIVNRGAIGSLNGGTTLVQAAQDVRNLGGRIAGQDVVVAAGRDVVNETQTITEVRTLENGYSAGATGVGAVASISATGSAAVLAGRDINLHGATVDAGKSALLAAGRDLNVGTVALGTTQDTESRGGQSYGHDRTTTHAGSTIQTGENVVAVAGRDATLTGSTIEAGGNASVIAGRDVTATAAIDTHTHSEASLGGKGVEYKQSSYDETARGSVVQAGNNATLAAGQNSAANAVLQSQGIQSAADASGGKGNLAVLGSSVTTGGATGGGGSAQLIATGDLTVGTVNETHASQYWMESRRSGFMSKEKTTKERNDQQSVAVGSVVSADSIAGSAGRDLTIAGSTVAATNGVNLEAGRNLTITSAQNTSSSHSFEQTTKSGFGATGSGLSYGKRDQKDTVNDNAVTQTASLVGSTDGSVHLKAGNTLKVTGSELIAAQDVTGVAADVTIEAAKGTQHHDETHEVKQSGFTLGVSGGAIGAAMNAANKISSATKSQDGRASALWGVAAARDAFDAGSALVGGASPAAGAALTLSWGSSQSKQTLTEDSAKHTSSRVTAGGNAAFIATGVDANGNQTAGNLNIVGSDVSAAKVALGAKNDINIVSASDTEESHSTNKSSSASVGISYGTQGFGVSASASKAKGNSDSVAATQVNSHVTGSDAVSIVSGNDTNILGGVVSGGKVSANVGGDLNVASRQDTQEVHARQQSMSGGFSISQGGGSASFSASKGKADGSYANVTEQSGIRASDGGFDITVKGNTDLKGAVIASTATADKNSLTTGTLTWSDVQNRSDYSATSGGISAGGAFGSPVGQSNSGSTSGKNTGGVGLMVPQHESGSQRGVAQAGVSAGAITLTDAANQKQDLVGLNRDTTSTNSTVGKNPDVANILSKQSDMMAAAQAAGEAVARTVGDIAASKEAAAKDALKQAKLAYDQDPSDANRVAMADAQASVDGWKEGGEYRAALHAAGGAMVAGLGGGNALAGAAGAGAASLAANKLAELGNSVAGSVDTGNAGLNEAIGNLAANVVAGGLGAVIGGGSGATTAANVDAYNRQLHPSEQQTLQDLQKGKSPEEQYKLAAAECALTHCADGIPDSDPNKPMLQKMQSDGQGYTTQQAQLKNAGAFDGYGTADRINDAADRYQVSNRAVGAVQGVTGVAAAAGALGAGCASVVGCALGTAVAVTSLDYSKAGFTQAVTGNTTPTYGEQALQSLGLSPGSAALAYGAINLGAAVGSSVLTNGAYAGIAKPGNPDQARITSNFHRDDNMTTGVLPAETVNQQFLNQGYSAPFTAGTYVDVGVAGTGTRANMVVSSGQAAALADGKPAVGAFSTPNAVPNQQYARGTLAITPAMKPDVSMLQPVATTGKPMVTVDGRIAPQSPSSQYPGGGNQTFYDYPAGSNRTDYVKPTSNAQSLPK